MRNLKGLNSQRLKEARLYRKMTMADLAEQAGINKQAISQFENNKNDPDPITLGKISVVLGFPYSFFTEKAQPSIIGNTYFRALYSSKKKDLAAQQVKAKYLSKIHSILSTKTALKFRELNLPPAPATVVTIEQLANYVRSYWELGNGPISNMVAILEKNGIIVGEFATGSRDIDAFYQYYEENDIPTFCVILGADKKSFYRRQFNCAHELGHILLHERYSDLNEVDREEFRTRENEANAFASAFLLPANSFGPDVAAYPNRLSHYVELKKKWNVSIMAMIMRARSLGYITTSQYTYLMRQMSSKGYKQAEPLDDQKNYAHPKALRQAISVLMDQVKMSGQDILDLFSNQGFSLSGDVLEELLNLEAGMLTQHRGRQEKIIQFPSI